MKPVNCALIGAGRIGQTYAEVIDRSEEVTLSAVVDAYIDAANSVTEQFGGQAFRSLQALFNAEVVPDFALICTPPVTHHGLTISCLEAGLHVLCEKPFATHSADAQAMVRAAHKQGRLLTMGSKFRYVPEVTMAREIINNGNIGEVIFFENVFTSRVDMSDRWNSDPRISGGGVLMDNGTHSLDIARYIFGALSEVQVIEGKRTQSLAVEDTVQINVRSANHALGRIDLSWSMQKPQDAYLSVYGSEGALHLGWKESRFQRHGQSEWELFGNGYSKYQALGAQVDNFARAIQGLEEVLIDAEDGLASVLAVEAAYQSLRQFHWTSIPTLACVQPARKMKPTSSPNYTTPSNH